MRGPAPKPATMRQRGPRAATRSTLPTESASSKRAVPALPKRLPGTGTWHPRVRDWWARVWRSPMAAEFLDADRPRLELLAELHQQFWQASLRGQSVVKLASEIRQQEIGFGLTPIDRRRLQWEVERGEVAEERTKKRRTPKQPAKDPRAVLKVV